MGHYTGLQGWVKFIDPKVMQQILDRKDWADITEHPFGSNSRASFIPWGAQNVFDNEYLPYIKEGKLYFTCSLKNYADTIAEFLDMLPLIAESWCLEMRYEEHLNSTWIIADIKQHALETIKCINISCLKGDSFSKYKEEFKRNKAILRRLRV